jgi:hypothetical protein
LRFFAAVEGEPDAAQGVTPHPFVEAWDEFDAAIEDKRRCM